MGRGVPLAPLALTWALSACAVDGAERAICSTAGAIVPLPALPEASGMAAGGGDGRLWLHNDSGDPVLIAVDAGGRQLGQLTLSGARVDDWEALASAPCGKSLCLYVGDIGDNNARRKQITIYRVTEPAQTGGSAAAEAIDATYPDGAHDAETLLASPDGTLFIVTKGDTGPVHVYRFPRERRSGSAVRLERVGVLSAAQPSSDARITDGAFSPDGRQVVLRTGRALVFYQADEFVLGHFRELHRADLSSLKEPQGEAVAFGPRNRVYVAGEGGGKRQPGTLAVLSCAP
jgi:hypothetical protein